MLRSIEGVFRDGKIELLESPPDVAEAKVLITFLPTQKSVELAPRGIDEADAAALRSRLRAFAEDWERPEMDVYDEL